MPNNPRTAYPYVKDSEHDLFGDFDAPEIEAEMIGSGRVEGSDDHYATFKVTVADVKRFTEFAGIRNTAVTMDMGGGVTRDTTVWYTLSRYQITPPDAKTPESYVDSVTVPVSGMASLKFLIDDGSLKTNYKAADSESETYYLHILVDGEELLWDQLYLRISASDTVGNQAVSDPPEQFDYLIDTFAPTVHFESVTREGVVVNDKGRIDITVNISATDYSEIDQMLYYVGDDWRADGTEWSVLTVEPGKTVSGQFTKRYGDDTGETDKVYTDTLWVKAIDKYGNESQPVAKMIVVSTQKPTVNAVAETDLNLASNAHVITVSGAPVSDLEGKTAYTRVYVTPVGDSEYSYVTTVKTGETVNVLGFEGLTWYKVKVSADDKFTYVSDGERVEAGYRLDSNSILYGLFTYYGDNCLHNNTSIIFYSMLYAHVLYLLGIVP